MKTEIAVGTKVGAGRWPMSGSHPDCWEKPWAGVVLATDDPRAWADGTFVQAAPGEKSISIPERIQKLPEAGIVIRSVPVLWNFNGVEQVYWEDPARLVPYHQDLASWFEQRGALKLAA